MPNSVPPSPASDTLTRAELAEAIRRNVGFSRTESADWVEKVLNEIISALASGEEVKISAFGTWLTRKKAARVGRNPKTKEPATISERRVVVFRASHILKALLNRG